MDITMKRKAVVIAANLLQSKSSISNVIYRAGSVLDFGITSEQWRQIIYDNQSLIEEMAYRFGMDDSAYETSMHMLEWMQRVK